MGNLHIWWIVLTQCMYQIWVLIFSAWLLHWLNYSTWSQKNKVSYLRKMKPSWNSKSVYTMEMATAFCWLQGSMQARTMSRWTTRKGRIRKGNSHKYVKEDRNYRKYRTQNETTGKTGVDEKESEPHNKTDCATEKWLHYADKR